MVNKALFSKKTDDWSTPVEFYKELDKEFGFTDDPCPLNGSGGLDRAWGYSVYCNPPYSDVRSWLEKGVKELELGNAKTIVYLLPARTCTKWFHDLVYNKAEIRFIKGRLKFGNSTNSAPFPSMIAIFQKNRLVEPLFDAGLVVKIRNNILTNILDRRGWGQEWDNFDSNIKDEIREDFDLIIIETTIKNYQKPNGED